jgi:hypothetical protein
MYSRTLARSAAGSSRRGFCAARCRRRRAESVHHHQLPVAPTETRRGSHYRPVQLPGDELLLRSGPAWMGVETPTLGLKRPGKAIAIPKRNHTWLEYHRSVQSPTPARPRPFSPDEEQVAKVTESAFNQTQPERRFDDIDGPGISWSRGGVRRGLDRVTLRRTRSNVSR